MSQDVYSEFLRLRKNVWEDHLYIMKSEYIHVLYRIYIASLEFLVRYLVEKRGERTTDLDILRQRRMEHKGDFAANPRYAREIAYVESIMDSQYTHETLKSDPVLLRIFYAPFRIVLSRYAYQLLLSCIEMNKYTRISELIFSQSRQRLVVSNSTLTESYVTQGYIEDTPVLAELDQVNAKPFTTGMLRDQFNFLKDLERVIQKKRLNTDKNVEVDFADKFPIEKSSNFFMGNAPEFKNKYLADFARDYVNRKPLDPDSPPNVLLVNLADAQEKISCVEHNRFFKILALGLMNGKIKLFYFAEDSDRDFKEEYRKELQRLHTGEGGMEILRPVTDIPDVSLETEYVTLIGHTAPITSLSLSYDDFHLLSASADSTIRLWNCKTGLCLSVYSFHIKAVWSVRLAPKGYYFASGGADRVVYFWGTNKSMPLKKFSGHSEEVNLVDFTKNMIYLVSASADKSVRFWSLEENCLARIFYFENPISCFAVDEVAAVLVVGDAEGNAVVWNIEKATRILKANLAGDIKGKHSKAIQGIDFSYDEKAVVIRTARSFSVYPLSYLREDKSKDVYEKFERGNSPFQAGELGHGATPFLAYENPDFRLLGAFFNMRNLLVVIARNFLANN